ncbi:DLW-39 family protein [Actinomyces sp. B33]|nr:DLW-39 family protein [Actinomyces sp. B33]MDC4232552.1 DLW-39 family protein [Actinomyces sp. B33]
MKKWIAAVVAVGSAIGIGLIVRQIVEDLSDNAELWTSVTDSVEV